MTILEFYKQLKSSMRYHLEGAFLKVSEEMKDDKGFKVAVSMDELLDVAEHVISDARRQNSE